MFSADILTDLTLIFYQIGGLAIRSTKIKGAAAAAPLHLCFP
jgi:hypothetical protein